MSVRGSNLAAASRVSGPMQPSTSTPVKPSACCSILADRHVPALTPMSNTLRSTPRGSAERIPVERLVYRARGAHYHVPDLDRAELRVVRVLAQRRQRDPHIGRAAGISRVVDVPSFLAQRESETGVERICHVLSPRLMNTALSLRPSRPPASPDS